MQCHWLWTRPHKAGQSAERGNENHSVNQQGHHQWGQAVHSRPPTNANQTESKQVKAYFSAAENPHYPFLFGLILSHVLSHLDRACPMGMSIASHSGKLFLIFMPSHLHRSCCQTGGCSQGHSRSGRFQVRWHSAAHTRPCPPHTRQCLKSMDMF